MTKFYRAIDPVDSEDTLFIVDELHDKLYCMTWDEDFIDPSGQSLVVAHANSGRMFADPRGISPSIKELCASGTLVWEAAYESVTN